MQQRTEQRIGNLWNKRELFAYLGYEPGAGQRAFHQSTARFRVLIAGARFGKSLAAAKEVLPVALTPETRTWICGPTYGLAEKEFEYVLHDLARLPGVRDEMKVTGTLGGRRMIRLPWNSEVVTKTADNPESLLGDELDFLLISEASRISRDVWERYLRPRLGSRRGGAVIPTTPAGAGSWIHDSFLRGLDQHEPEWASFGPFSTLENPTFDRDEYEAARRLLPEEVFAEQYEGRFVRRSGLVYSEFERSRHVVATTEDGSTSFPGATSSPCATRSTDESDSARSSKGECWPREASSWPLWRTVDFGYRNPFACLWVRRAPDGSAWVEDELYGSGWLVEDAAREILRRDRGRRVVATLADHDAEDRATLLRHGVPTLPAPKAVGPGIETVKRFLRAPPTFDLAPDSLREQASLPPPGVRVHPRCRNLIHEFETYAWEEEPLGLDRNAPTRPRPWFDHALDALRYLLHYWRLRSRPAGPSCGLRVRGRRPDAVTRALLD